MRPAPATTGKLVCMGAAALGGLAAEEAALAAELAAEARAEVAEFRRSLAEELERVS